MQPNVDARASAVVLAGGKSSRMGTSKALLLFDNQPLIVHIVDTLKRLFAEVVVVASPGQEIPSMPVTLVRDEVAYQGPVGGLCYGLGAATGEVCFVTACDSAFLSPALIFHLVDRSAACDVVVPHWQGRFQPLHAVYRRSVLPLLEAQLARGELRPVSLFERVRTLRIDEEEIRRFDSDGSSFFNMNSPADYDQALERWGAIHAAGRAPGVASITCTVELFGVARMVGRASEVVLTLPSGATLAQLFGELASQLPALVGRVITADRNALMDGYACSVNGREFVHSSDAAIGAGDSILILSADAGG